MVKRRDSKDYVQLTPSAEAESLNKKVSKSKADLSRRPHSKNALKGRRKHSSRGENRSEENSPWCLESSRNADEAFASYLGQKEKQSESPLNIFSTEMGENDGPRVPISSSKLNLDDLNSSFRDNVDTLLDDLLEKDSASPGGNSKLDPLKRKDTVMPYPEMTIEQNNRKSKAAPLKTLEEYINITSHSSSAQTPDIPVDPLHLKTNGILIVDPQQNGQVYKLSEKNRSLTDKDLLIIRKHKDTDMDDDESIISNLTEVTYKQAKKERLKLIMNHLKRSPSYTSPDNQFCCAALPFFSNESDDVDHEPVKYDHVKANNLEHSLTDDAALYLKSLMKLKGKYDSSVHFGNFSESVIVCITRIYMATQEEVKKDASLNKSKGRVSGTLGIRCVSKDPTLSHDLGVKLIEGTDGQAFVRDVISDSTAGRSGVAVGDFLSFAVPLNNTFQGYERACDFISRLEMIGMRTSYRELFDMFLSKTSSGWPLAIVFRRKSPGMFKFERISFGLPSLNLEVDFLRASNFLHELITRSREYDYYREADGLYETIRGNIEYFLPSPIIRDAWPISNTTSNVRHSINHFAKSIGMNGDIGEGTPFLPVSSTASEEYEIIHPNFRRSALLTGYTENSFGILFVRCSGSFGGSGVALFRSNDGSWSTPIALCAKMSVGIQLGSTTIECITFLQSEEIVSEFLERRALTINTQNEGRLDYLSYTKINGSFFCTIQLDCSFEIRDDLNSSFYEAKGNENVTAIDLFEGKIPRPVESIGLFGALRRLEFPSTMYPHPTPPENLMRYAQNDWDLQLSCQPSSSLEPPLDESGHLTIRELLSLLTMHPVQYSDESREIEIFTQKFKQMLFDGVSIDRIWPFVSAKKKDDTQRNLNTMKGGQNDKVFLKLCLLHEQSLDHATLKFLTRAKFESKSSTPKISENNSKDSDSSNITELSIKSIIRISQSMTNNFFPSIKPPHQKDKKRKRFVSIEVDGGNKVMFLARTGKDASLLSCGLKLLVERLSL